MVVYDWLVVPQLPEASGSSQPSPAFGPGRQRPGRSKPGEPYSKADKPRRAHLRSIWTKMTLDLRCHYHEYLIVDRALRVGRRAATAMLQP